MADGGSGLDIKLNQLKPLPPTTPTTSLLKTTFVYHYATPDSTVIAKKTQADIVVRGGVPTPDIVQLSLPMAQSRLKLSVSPSITSHPRSSQLSNHRQLTKVKQQHLPPLPAILVLPIKWKIDSLAKG